MREPGKMTEDNTPVHENQEGRRELNVVTLKSSSSTSDSGLNRSVELNDSDPVTVIQISTGIVSVLKKFEIGAKDGIIIKRLNSFFSDMFQASIHTASTVIFPLRTS